ncbi:MAG: hypothetical protein WDZ51_20165 [Pirellulaceae bacterium]
MSGARVSIIEGASRRAIEATLVEGITRKHLHDVEMKWKPWRSQRLKELGDAITEESSHWDWEAKVDVIEGLVSYAAFVLECGGDAQGIMILNTGFKFCRIQSQDKMPLVYVEFLETAPWNRKQLVTPRRYCRVGPALIDVAIQVSEQVGYQGRLGLHSLPQSDGWYRDICGMTDLGIDRDKGLRYFEMTIEQAAAYLKEGR